MESVESEGVPTPELNDSGCVQDCKLHKLSLLFSILINFDENYQF